MGKFHPELLAEPATLRDRFTPTGYVKGDKRRHRFQVTRSTATGDVLIWTRGPMGWWHDFQSIEPGTSFDDAVRMTFIPSFLGWERAA